MRTSRLLAVLFTAALLGAGGAGVARADTPSDTGVTATGTGDAFSDNAIGAIVNRMTLEEKVGQLFVIPAYGTDANTVSAADAAANLAAYKVATPAEVVAKYHLGGVIYFAWTNSLINPAQIATLSNGLQRAALDSGAGVPLMISTDQEQGSVVTRMPQPPTTYFPGNMALGATRSATDAYTSAQVTGAELAAVGINQDFAPVSDVNINPANPVIGVRSFGSDPAMVAGMVAAQVPGFHDGGVAATAKHFPGHGDTGTDSHTGLPVITHTLEQWQQIDAPPFEAAIAAGIDSIMTAHLQVPALDPSGDPATLSYPILTGVLRHQLGFQGVIVTDSLGMAGVRTKYGDARVPVLAIKAGADQMLMPPDMDLAYSSVLGAVRNGEISENRIDASVRRILIMKMHRGVLANPMIDAAAAPSAVGSAAHLAAAQAVADDTVTAVRNDDGVLPLAAGRKILVTGWNTTAFNFNNVDTLAARLADQGAVPTSMPGVPTTTGGIAATVAAAGANDVTVVLTNRAWTSAAQRNLVAALLGTGKPVIVVAVREPYDVAWLPGTRTYLATYGYTPVSMAALAKVLTGAIPANGRLPVAITAAGDTGTILYPYGSGLSLTP